jgi:predicted GH43/DUF377 family glycosyl hydrolase
MGKLSDSHPNNYGSAAGPLEGKPGMILGPGPAGWWDSERVSCPRVLRLADGRWRMWYYGRDPSFDREINMQSGRVGLAESRDGLRWTRIRGPLTMGAVFEPSTGDRFDSGHVGITDIHLIDNEYVMWYYGGDQKYIELPSPRGIMKLKGMEIRIGRAVSNDGINWKRIDGPYRGAVLDHGSMSDWDALMVNGPQVVHEPDGSYRMYYHTYNPSRGGFLIGLAVSRDLMTWEKKGVVISPGPAGSWYEMGGSTHHVLKVEGQYVMFFEGLDRSMHYCIGLATSSDGLVWQVESEPVFRHSPRGSGAWDALAVGTPWVVPMPDGSYRMYYVGMNEASPNAGELGVAACIGVALSDGHDFRKWRRYGE